MHCIHSGIWIIWYQMIGKNFEKNVHEFVWGRSGYETVDIDEDVYKRQGYTHVGRYLTGSVGKEHTTVSYTHLTFYQWKPEHLCTADQCE